MPGGAALAPAYGPSPSVEIAGPIRRSRHRAKSWRMVPDTHCRATLRLHRPTVLPLPLELAGPVRRSRHRAKRGAWRRMSIAGRRCACTGLRSFPFCGVPRPGKAQPPPGSAFTLPVLLLAEDAQYILTMLQQLRVIAVAGKGQRQRELGDNPSRTRRHHQHPLAQQQRLFDIVGH